MLIDLKSLMQPSTYFTPSALTREDVVQVPGQHSIQHSVQAHHADGGQKGELVPFQGTGLDVVPL